MLSSWSSTTRIRGFLRSIVFAEEALNFSDHGSPLAWLGEVSIARDFQGFLSVGREGVCGERDARDRFGRSIVRQYLRRPPGINDRDRDIHQDQIGLFR